MDQTRSIRHCHKQQENTSPDSARGGVTDEMLGWAGESRNGFLCTCDGVEFFRIFKNHFFLFNCLLLFYISNVYNGIFA